MPKPVSSGDALRHRKKPTSDADDVRRREIVEGHCRRTKWHDVVDAAAIYLGVVDRSLNYFEAWLPRRALVFCVSLVVV